MSTIVLLTHLMRLHLSVYETTPPKGIRSLTSLEVLHGLWVNDDSTDTIEELGHLTELKSLKISIRFKFREWNDGLEKSLVDSLNKLHKVRDLDLVSYGCCLLDGWVAPRHLRTLHLKGCRFSMLPAWMSPSFLPDLVFLKIEARRLQQEDLEILGRLPALCYLGLKVDHEDLGIYRRFTVAACSFPCLLNCYLSGFGEHVVFEQGAMPRLTSLKLELSVQEAREFNSGFDLGIGNLVSLQIVVVWLQLGGASAQEADEARAAVRQAVEAHPNHPELHIFVRVVALLIPSFLSYVSPFFEP